jgi:nitroreductase
MGIIKIIEPEAFPSLSSHGEELCINCGHCVAVCPHGALRLEKMKPDECDAVRKELLPTPEQVVHVLRSRRSVRSYSEKPVPREILSELFNIARYAPSAHNDQPVHWIVIEDKKELKNLTAMTVDWMRFILKEIPEMADVDVAIMEDFVKSWEQGEDPILRGAPQLIVGYVDQSTLMPIENCTIALTYLELAAFSLGLGACWAGAFQMAATSHPPIMDALQLPEGHQSYGAMMIGYPKHRFLRIPLRNDPYILWR